MAELTDRVYERDVPQSQIRIKAQHYYRFSWQSQRNFFILPPLMETQCKCKCNCNYNQKLSNTSNKPLKTTTTVSNAVADATSVGGLGAVEVDNESGKIDVALDYVPPTKDDEQDKNGHCVEESKRTVLLN